MSTALAELWCLIHHVNLDTNQASIFYALMWKTRRGLIPRRTTDADRLIRALETPRIWETANAASVDTRLDDADWAEIIDDLVEFLADDLASQFGWTAADGLPPEELPDIEARREFLRAFLVFRVGEGARTGDPGTAELIAARLGRPPRQVGRLQTEVNKAVQRNAQRYRRIVEYLADIRVAA